VLSGSETVVTKRNGARQDARSRARERLTAMNRERAARDERIETATAAAMAAIDKRAAAEAAVIVATQELGERLRALLNEFLSAKGVAQLCDLEVADVRRLTRAAPEMGPEAERSRMANY
jgi:hypothetical protein